MNQENLIRTLKDEPPYTERLLCGFGFHRWTNWSEPGHISSNLYLQQQRSCVDCGRVQVKNVRGSA